MRLTIYDRNPGTGFMQWCLMASWAVGCWLQRLLGLVDDYYGAESWDDAYQWLNKKGPILSLQYWGHGSPGTAWLAGRRMDRAKFVEAVGWHIGPLTTIWFRCCSMFQGVSGQKFAVEMADALSCTIAAHTRIIGLFQGGLHTIRPHEKPSWPVEEGELKNGHLLPIGNNVVFCLRTSIPKGW